MISSDIKDHINEGDTVKVKVLSVGDAKFKKKSEKKIMGMFDSGVTVLFVSHSLAQVRRLCNKAIILEKGKLVAAGGIDEVSAIYEEMIK